MANQEDFSSIRDISHFGDLSQELKYVNSKVPYAVGLGAFSGVLARLVVGPCRLPLLGFFTFLTVSNVAYHNIRTDYRENEKERNLQTRMLQVAEPEYRHERQLAIYNKVREDNRILTIPLAAYPLYWMVIENHKQLRAPLAFRLFMKEINA